MELSSKLEKAARDIGEKCVEVQKDRFSSPNYTFFQTIGVSHALNEVDVISSTCTHCLVRRTLIRMYRDVISMCERKIRELTEG